MLNLQVLVMLSTLSTTVLFIPVLVGLGGVFVCAEHSTWGASGFQCFVDAHMFLVILSTTFGIVFTLYCIAGKFPVTLLQY